MQYRIPTATDVELNGLMDWFLRHENETRSVDMLDENLKAVLNKRLDSKQLDLVLFHTAMALNASVYGDGEDDWYKARRVIHEHIQRWTDKFIPALHKQEASGKNGVSFNIAQTLGAFKFLELQPPERLTTVLKEKILGHINDFDTNHFTPMFSSLGRLALPLEDDFIKAVTKRVKTLIPNFSPDEMIEILHSLAVIDCVQKTHTAKQHPALKETFDALYHDHRVEDKLKKVVGAEHMLRRLLDSTYWFKGVDLVKSYPKGIPDKRSDFESDAKAAF